MSVAGKFIVPVMIVLLGHSAVAFAGGAVMRRQQMGPQMKAQREAMMRQQIQQQMQAQVASAARQKAQSAAQQQAVGIARQQAAVVAEVRARQMASQAAAVAQYQAQKAAVQSTGQAAVAAQYGAQQAAVQAVAFQRQAEDVVRQQVLEAGIRQKMAEESGEEYFPELQEEVQEIATLDDVLSSLDATSEAWPLMIDAEAKEEVVRQYVHRYRGQGVVIQKPSAYYALMIDAMSLASPEMLQRPFPQILQAVAILEYDFDNGSDKDAMALKILGSPQAVAENKQRLGME